MKAGGNYLTTAIADAAIDASHPSEVVEARSQLLRRAEAQGVKPIATLDALVGDPGMTPDFEVDEFLRQVREDRNRP